MGRAEMIAHIWNDTLFYGFWGMVFFMLLKNPYQLLDIFRCIAYGSWEKK